MNDPDPAASPSRDATSLPPITEMSSPTGEEAGSPTIDVGNGSGAVDDEAEPPARGIDGPLFSRDKCRDFDEEWQRIQVSFVDEPQAAVKQADVLVKKTIDALTASFSGLRSSLEKTWEREEEVSTEQLRQALQSYRSFFRRLLSI